MWMRSMYIHAHARYAQSIDCALSLSECLVIHHLLRLCVLRHRKAHSVRDMSSSEAARLTLGSACATHLRVATTINWTQAV